MGHESLVIPSSYCPKTYSYRPGGFSIPGASCPMVPKSKGALTRVLKGSFISALAVQAPHQAPPPTSKAADELEASKMISFWLPNVLHTLKRHCPKNVSLQKGARP